jgi:hypothetical protein
LLRFTHCGLDHQFAACSRGAWEAT